MNNFIKLIPIACSILATNTAFASFVIGVDGGYAWRKATPFAVIGSSKVDYTTDLKDDGGVFGVFAGYQVIANRVLAGFEANVSWEDFGDTKSYAGVFNTTLPPAPPVLAAYNLTGKYKRELVLSASFRLGYFILDQVAAYLRAGVQGSHDRVEIDQTILIAGAPVVATIDTASRSTSRPLIGAGLEYFITSNISLRGEYNYLHKSGGFATIHSPLQVMDVHVEPRQHVFKAALAWNFA